jgi:multiple sugar transport system ATP-binding protein
MSKYGITIKNVTKNWGDIYALKSVSLDIEPGSFTTLLGPSGCGKTTLLRSIAGLEEPSGGEIRIGDKIVYGSGGGIFVSPKDRNLGLVFQSYALWPHMKVRENITFGLHLKKLSAGEIKKKTDEVLEVVGLQGYEERYPSELSGGQQQRVSLARILAVNPMVLLMDEPLSNLDAKLRISLRAELKRIHKATGLTVIYVTHDQIEAMSLSTHIAVMKEGVIQDYGTPDEVYQFPSTTFVADFMGNPQINLISGIADIKDGKKIAVSEKGNLEFEIYNYSVKKGDRVIIGFRPEDTVLTADPGSSLVVDSVQKTGPDLLVTIRIGEELIISRVDKYTKIDMDQNVKLSIPAKVINLFNPETKTKIPKID